jgi:hypothetical protein
MSHIFQTTAGNWKRKVSVRRNGRIHADLNLPFLKQETRVIKCTQWLHSRRYEPSFSETGNTCYKVYTMVAFTQI